MLDYETRTAILRLHKQGLGHRTIARALSISRNSVKRVLRQGTAQPPPPRRAEKAVEHIDRIRELYADCKGNLVRVHEELAAADIHIPYTTLTGFCRRHGIGVKEKKRVGRYPFEPGQEMQHDTSPHRVQIGDKQRKLQCASLILCYSRLLYAQAYATFNRFYAKVFLTDALRYFGGSAQQCMVDIPV